MAKLIQECNALRQDWLERTVALNEDKQSLTDKSLAFEEARNSSCCASINRPPSGDWNVCSNAGPLSTGRRP